MTYLANNHWKQFLYRLDCSEDELQSLDYVSDDDGFIRYKGILYHLCDFMVSNGKEWPNAPFPVHGYAPDSFFSGLILHVSDDGESYKIATYIN